MIGQAYEPVIAVREYLDELAARLRGQWPSLTSNTRVECGDPASAIVAQRRTPRRRPSRWPSMDEQVSSARRNLIPPPAANQRFVSAAADQGYEHNQFAQRYEECGLHPEGCPKDRHLFRISHGPRSR